MSEKMSYNECLAYAAEHKIVTYSNNHKDGIWTASGLQDGRIRSLDAPDFIAVINLWKANYGEPCDPTE